MLNRLSKLAKKWLPEHPIQPSTATASMLHTTASSHEDARLWSELLSVQENGGIDASVSSCQSTSGSTTQAADTSYSTSSCQLFWQRAGFWFIAPSQPSYSALRLRVLLENAKNGSAAMVAHAGCRVCRNHARGCRNGIMRDPDAQRASQWPVGGTRFVSQQSQQGLTRQSRSK